MLQQIFLSLHEKHSGDPLGEDHLKGLMKLDLLLPQNSEHGHFILNLYEGEKYVGMTNIVWDGTLEYLDPIIGRYLLGSAYLDDIDLIEDVDGRGNDEVRKLIMECMRRANISLHPEIRKPNEIRDFIIALARLN